MIVADSGPLIAFARIGRLDLLETLFRRVLIPDAVFHEVVVAGRGRPGSQNVAASSWLERRPLTDRASLARLPPNIHAGEREAILLAHTMGLPLLIDERRGRRFAEGIGVEVFGSLRVLVAAYRRGIIADAAVVAEEMVASGYWISPALRSTLTKEILSATS